MPQKELKLTNPHRISGSYNHRLLLSFEGCYRLPQCLLKKPALQRENLMKTARVRVQIF